MQQEINPRFARYIRWPSDGESSPITSFTQQWAKRYLQKIDRRSEEENTANRGLAIPLKRKQGVIAYTLRQSLRLFVARAWSKTEQRLAESLKHHQLNIEFLNSWALVGKTHDIYDKVLEMYGQQESPQQLAVEIGPALGELRQEYTRTEPLAIGFINLQFYYTGQLLLQQVSDPEQSVLESYFKVIQEHLNMPLQRAYQAAAEHECDSIALSAVQQLLPVCQDIAESVCDRVIELFPNYRSVTGNLGDSKVKTSSIRDVEMFLVYLWVCVLEQNIAVVQQELFPLCVMLYPVLGVKWDLVRQMLHLLGQKLRDRLTTQQYALFIPYLQAMWEMFSPAVFSPKEKKQEFQPESIESLGIWVVG